MLGLQVQWLEQVAQTFRAALHPLTPTEVDHIADLATTESTPFARELSCEGYCSVLKVYAYDFSVFRTVRWKLAGEVRCVESAVVIYI